MISIVRAFAQQPPVFAIKSTPNFVAPQNTTATITGWELQAGSEGTLVPEGILVTAPGEQMMVSAFIKIGGSVAVTRRVTLQQNGVEIATASITSGTEVSVATVSPINFTEGDVISATFFSSTSIASNRTVVATDSYMQLYRP